MKDDLKKMGISTRAAHAGSRSARSSTEPEVPAIYASAVFTFDSLEHIDRVWDGHESGFVYSRMKNPTVELLEEAVAVLEGATSAVAFSSGMAAISSTFSALASSGDHIVAADVIYGATHGLLSGDLSKRGITTSFVNANDLQQVESAMRPNTKILFVEMISNPLMEVADLEGLAKVASRHGALLVVDASFATPYLVRPIEWGAAAVVHSATKYLNGHSDVTLGVAAFDDRVKINGTPIGNAVRALAVSYGPCPSPFDAWLLLRGIRTLPLRMARHSENAKKLADFLSAHPKVRRVNYPGLESSPFSALSAKYLPKGVGGMLSFEVYGGLEGANLVMKSLHLARIVPSLGGIGTTVTHPGRTSHRGIPVEERERLGVGDGLIRVSVGIEDYADIERDFKEALDRI